MKGKHERVYYDITNYGKNIDAIVVKIGLNNI